MIFFVYLFFFVAKNREKKNRLRKNTVFEYIRSKNILNNKTEKWLRLIISGLRNFGKSYNNGIHNFRKSLLLNELLRLDFLKKDSDYREDMGHELLTRLITVQT